ncbi:MAG: M36 family metallopeptidase [Actinomycetota bacterium]
MANDRVFHLRRVALALAALLALAAGTLPADAAQELDEGPGFQGETGILPDLDRREGSTHPTAPQQAAADALGATVRWSAFGTPRTLVNHGGFLGRARGDPPAEAARAWLLRNRGLFRLSAGQVRDLEVVSAPVIGDGHAVLFQQRAGGVTVAPEGLITVAVIGGKVAFASSSAVGSATAPARATLSAEAAFAAAAANVGRSVDAGAIRREGGSGQWTFLTVKRLSGPNVVRAVAFPLPTGGTIPAYETFLVDGHEAAYRHVVDGRTGQVLIRRNELDFAGEPKWDVFPASPPLDLSSADTRETWCWEPAEGCDRVVQNEAATVPWDVLPRLASQSTRTSLGNAGWAREKWLLADVAIVTVMGRPLATDGILPAVPRPNRDYQYAWGNTWFEQRCSEAAFATPARNDLDAALANLHVGHNRMHDWSYHLGFTEESFNAQDSNFGRGGREGDPEHGNAQAGAVVSSGILNFLSRDNANQITPPDGIPPISNMFLWQPIAAAFYGPCVDGDFDTTVIGHEYTHLISNRMVAGPDQRLVGLQANAMGESWSDLMAVEYLNEYGFVPLAGENPFAVGPYVTGDHQAGIRNYGMNASPLNYSNVGYDLTGPQVHADGEIWSATNFDIRQAMVARYDREFPAGDQALQEACADGQVPVDQCPGNRRWTQLVFDAWLLMADGGVSMVDARDAMLAADVMRFGGANQDLLWNVFARRGLGEGASSAGSADTQPTPSFESPFADEARLRFEPVDRSGAPIEGAQLFVGHYEARGRPVADTDPETPLPEEVGLVAGRYDFLVRADGFGMRRLTRALPAGQDAVLRVPLASNVASVHNGATATGDGVNLQHLIDDTEGTNWAAFGASARGRQVTVDLAGDRPQRFSRIQVSAMLRPRNAQDPNDPATQNRFTALRQFEILTCTRSATVDCTQEEHFTVLYTSPPDAFPSIAPRPRVPELILRSFDVGRASATHVRLRVLESQCTGAPDYQGEQDDDPLNDTDCDEGRLAIVTILNGNQGNIVRAAELQVLGG